MEYRGRRFCLRLIGVYFCYFLGACLLFLLRHSSYAGQCRIEGYVYTNNAPVSGAEVILVKGHEQRKIVTGKDGRFVFKDLEPGEYLLKAGKLPTYPFIWWKNAEKKYHATKIILRKNGIINNIRFNLWPKFLFTLL